jgi:hypothetical protein
MPKGDINSKKWYVYRHIRLDKNLPFYIGIGNGRNYFRAFSKKDRNKYWNNIVNKYGYEIEIILDNLDVKIAINKEIEFIKLYGRVDLNCGTLCNLTDGGDGTTNPSQEMRDKVSERTKGNKWNVGNKYFLGEKLTEEHKDAIRKSQLGKKLSIETKNKIREINKGKTYSEEVNKKKGRKLTDEQKRNLSEKLKGRKKSDETRQKMSESRKGWIPSEEVKEKIRMKLKGSKPSLETRKKLSESQKKRYA